MLQDLHSTSASGPLVDILLNHMFHLRFTLRRILLNSPVYVKHRRLT